MNFDVFENFLNILIKDVVAFYHSPFFMVVKILLGIYALVLIVDIILLIIQRNFVSNIREGFTIGMNIPPELTTDKKKLQKKWTKIKERLKGENESEYKVAIIEADNLIDSLLQGLSFAGENMGDRLDKIPPGQLDFVEELKMAHEIKNRIIHEENFQVSREKAKETIELYEKFLDYFDALN